MKSDEKARLKALTVKIAVVAVICALYYVFITLTGASIPCIIKAVTGYYCPGCGLTRMFSALARLDFYTAVRCNMLVAVLIIPVAVFAFYRSVLYVKGKQKPHIFAEKAFIALIAVLTVAFWIMRNLPQFEFLAPI